jgi:hypothetical protein
MAANVINSLQNVTGFTVALAKVKHEHLRGAAWDFMHSPSKMAEAIAEKSDFMKTRQTEQMAEAQNGVEQLLNPSKFEEVKDFAIKHGYVLQGLTQNTLDNVVWRGAYDQAISEGLREREAVMSADSAVRLTQGSANVEDVSRIETQNAFVRIFTMFYGYFNMLANLTGTEFAKTQRELGFKASVPRLVFIYSATFMLPAFIGALISAGGAGKLDEDDDGQYLDDLFSMFFGSQIRQATAMVPGGSAIQASLNAFNSKVSDDRIAVSPAIQALEAAGRVPGDLYHAAKGDHVSGKQVARDSLTLIGLLSGLPAGALSRPVGYLLDVKEGKARPKSTIDAVRGLATGKSSK